uniref:Uncharacterized protein n=1 Tax=Utricularia reniformis TaxID=192314 RepID=A0A1Y0AYZ8_9LAMI|nr:hypothetical protein AEK19_MT1510 [Utricularia reniformis]ART30384.1 hypothetical protein AEK19_MT1510 [Utricularia reniformis]
MRTHVQQGQPSTSGPSLEDMLKTFVQSTMNFQKKTESSIQTLEKSVN